MTSSPSLRGRSCMQAHRGVLQTTDDDRRQRAKQCCLPTLCLWRVNINGIACMCIWSLSLTQKTAKSIANSLHVHFASAGLKWCIRRLWRSWMDGFRAKPATWCDVYCVPMCCSVLCVYLTKARVDCLMVRGPLGSKWSHWLKPALEKGPLPFWNADVEVYTCPLVQ